AAVLIGSYLAGAIPFGVLIARGFYHVDIRTMGSRNTGATNVWRSLGPRPGATTLALDALKGAVGVAAARHWFPASLAMPVAAGVAAIVGHNWSVFLRGSGGKGVATSAGVFLALMPVQTLVAIAVFLGFFLTTGHVSVGSMAAATALAVASFVVSTPWPLRLLVVVAAAMVLLKHIPNMRRLSRGEEPKVKFR
ncbi:MAG: glycerol-3-phosphate 1-O-acyltransferase PlsY, partial [Elusimicrobia bacterium]|nr:glycerol-3-phosphate 1-O-acyltransferase PlsY [Elusimicrobiota bacterium]